MSMRGGRHDARGDPRDDRLQLDRCRCVDVVLRTARATGPSVGAVEEASRRRIPEGNDAQADEIKRLSERVSTLEQSIEGMRERYETQLAFERASHEAEIGLQRHATRNAKQILHGMLDLIEAAPGNASAHASKMRERLMEMEKVEAAESAAIRSAKIIATKQGEKE